jgi:Cu/Ag efflux pump CusA
MRWIIGSSLKFRRLIVAVAAGLLILGITQLGKSSVDLLPEFSPPRVEVQTEALGLSAEEMEELITVPLEQDLLNGIAFLENIESSTLPGFSSIVMTFEPGTDLLDARQVVEEKLTEGAGAAGSSVARPSRMLQPLSSTSRVSMVRLSSKELSPIQMSVLARWVITPRLLGVDGVANVAIWGFRDRQLQVLVDPQRLADQKVSLQQIIRTTGNALDVSPLKFLESSVPGTGGFIDTVNQRLQIFHEQAIKTPDELEQVPIESLQGAPVLAGGKPLALGDVAEVVEDHQPLIGDALCRDGECLLLVIEKFPGANALEVTRGVDAAFDAMRPGLKGLEIDSSIYRPATYIRSSFKSLGGMLLIGLVLLLLLIGAFFYEWRSALISAIVIPVALVTAGLVFYFRGATVNMMVVAGFVMGLTVVIDDAVADIHNFVRKLRERRLESRSPMMWRVILEAAVETRSAILFATLIVVAALLPALFMQGQGGAFFPSIAMSYLLALGASMLVALTLTPALGVFLLADAPLDRESPVVKGLKRAYGRVFAGITRRPLLPFALFAVVIVAAIVVAPFLKTALQPSLKERDILVRLQAAPGTSLPKMNEVASRVFDDLREIKGVRNIGAHVGRAVLSDQIVNVNSGEIWVSIESSADYDATVSEIKRSIAGEKALTGQVLTYSNARANDVLSKPTKDLVVRLYGDDEEVLSSKAKEVHGLIARIDGVSQPKVEVQPVEAALEVEVDLPRARAAGVKPGDVRRAAATLLGGITAGNLFEEQKVFDVVVWGRPDMRKSEADIKALLVDTPNGGHVRLGEVADVRIADNPTVIRHESVSKYLDVSAAVEGRSVNSVTADVENALHRVKFPLDHHAEVLGGYADAQAARNRILTIAVAAAIGIFVLLQAAFASWRLATLVFLSLPMSVAGGVLAAAVSGRSLTLWSLAGMFAILGIAVRGAIPLIRQYQNLQHRQGQAFGSDLVLSVTQDRLSPILMTTFGTAVLMLPFLFGGGAPGLEIIRPMAIVILGGLITAALLNLVVIPSFYLRYGSAAKPDLSTEDVFAEEREVEPVGAGVAMRART